MSAQPSDNREWRDRTDRGIAETDRYDAWASDYDSDHAHFGMLLLTHFVGMFCRHVAAGTGPILDAGAGTGRLAEALSLHGYVDFVGLDMSAGMLQQADSKGLYSSLHQARLGDPLDLETESFAAVASLAAMAPGLAGADSFDELIRVARPNAPIVLSLRAGHEETTGFNKRRAELEAAGQWALIDETPPFVSHPELDPPLHYGVHVYRKAP